MDKIIFADSEEKLLKVLNRILENESDLDIKFLSHSDEVINQIRSEGADMVVCDLTMFLSNGEELLTYLKNNFPGIIRVVLTGYSQEAIALQAFQKAHQLFLKPVESFLLKERIYKTLAVKDLVRNENLRVLISGINQIPVLPEFYYELEQLLEQPDVSINEIKKLITHDPALVAKILQLVNSAFFGFSKNITDLTQAISFLGLKIIKTLVLYLSVTESVNISPNLIRVQNEIWHHSLKSASIARDIATELRFNQEEIDNAYAAGILHDIGKLVLLGYDSYYNKVHTYSLENKITFHQAEYVLYGTSHAEAGAYLLGLWGLPGMITDSVCKHHNELFSDNIEINIKTVIQITELVSRNSNINIPDIVHQYILNNPERSSNNET